MAGIISLILCSAGTAFAAGTIQYGNVRFKHLDGSDGLPHNTVYSITQDDYGFMWFATAGGLCRYDGYDVTVFLHKEGDSSSLRHDFVRNLYNDPYRQSIWISTETGVCRYDYDEDIFCSYDIEGNRSDNVRFLVTGKEHGLLAVCSNGIFRYDAGKDVFEPFIRRPGHVFYTAAEDSSSMLWITTNKGLLCYDLLSGYENVTLHDFTVREDWVLDLSNYKDTLHYGEWINDEITRCIASGAYAVSSREKIDGASQTLRAWAEAQIEAGGWIF